MTLETNKLNSEQSDQQTHLYRSSYFDWLKLTKKHWDDGLISKDMALPMLQQGLSNLDELYQNDFIKTLAHHSEYIKQVSFWGPLIFDNKIKVLDLLTEQIQNRDTFQELLLWGVQTFLQYDDNTRREFYEINFGHVINAYGRDLLLCGTTRHHLMPLNYHYNLFTKVGQFLHGYVFDDNVKEQTLNTIYQLDEDVRKLFSKEDYKRIQIPQNIFVYGLSSAIEKWQEWEIDNHTNLEHIVSSKLMHTYQNKNNVRIDSFIKCLEKGMRADVRFINNEKVLDVYLKSAFKEVIQEALKSVEKRNNEETNRALEHVNYLSNKLCEVLESLAKLKVSFDTSIYHNMLHKNMDNTPAMEKEVVAKVMLSLTLALNNMDNPNKSTKRMKI